MRIIGGSKKGAKITAPNMDTTRPFSDRAREALFNMLGDIEGLSMLDAYSGSGGVALEGLSRGARNVTVIEKSRSAVDVIRKNARQLGLADSLIVEPVSVEYWLRNSTESYDIVVADPPFAETDSGVIAELAARATRIFALKHSRRREPLEIPALEVVRSRRYGDSTVSIYVRA